MSLLSGLFLFLGLFTIFPPQAISQQSDAVREGIAQYNRGEFEKVIETLTTARGSDPASAEAALYLGMAYRRLNDLPKAYRQFEDAVRLTPLNDYAIMQLIEAATLVDKLEEAWKWITFSEQNNLHPARVAFFKGLVLAKEARYSEAISAFERAKHLDPSHAPSADLQIGVCYINQRQYTKATDLFQSAITKDPLSDAASWARRYLEAAEHWRYIERPLRIMVGVTSRYDSNYRKLGYPDDSEPAWNAYLDSTVRHSLAMQNLVRLDFVPILPSPFLFNATYTAMNVLHQRYGTENDTIANAFTLAPGLNHGHFAMNLVANYTHMLQRDPGYRRHSELSSVGPLLRLFLERNQLIEFYGYYTRRNDFRLPISSVEDQTSRDLETALSWFWFYEDNALLSIKLGYGNENAEGMNHDHHVYRTSVNLVHPLVKGLQLQVSGEFSLHDYDNENTLIGNVKREDRSYTGTVGLTWAVANHLDLIASYLLTRVNANIYLYEYRREIWSLGIEMKF